MNYEDPTFLELLCDRKRPIQILFGMAATFLVLNVPLLFYHEWGSANSVVTVLNVVGTVVIMSGCFYVLRKCNSQSEF